MLPNKLFAKSVDGRVVPFEVDGVEFIDGSIMADLPFKRMVREEGTEGGKKEGRVG